MVNKAAIAAPLFGGAGALAASLPAMGGASSGIVPATQTAFNTSMLGVPGLTANNLLWGAGAYASADQIIDPKSATRTSINTAIKDPSLYNVVDAAGNVGMTGLGFAGLPVKAGLASLADDAINAPRLSLSLQNEAARLTNPEAYRTLRGTSSGVRGKISDYYFNSLQKNINKQQDILSKKVYKARQNGQDDLAEQYLEESSKLREKVLNEILPQQHKWRLKYSGLPISTTGKGGGQGAIYQNNLNPEELIKVGSYMGDEQSINNLIELGKHYTNPDAVVAFPTKAVPYGMGRENLQVAQFMPKLDYKDWMPDAMTPEQIKNHLNELNKLGVGIDYQGAGNIGSVGNKLGLVDLTYVGTPGNRTNHYFSRQGVFNPIYRDTGKLGKFKYEVDDWATGRKSMDTPEQLPGSSNTFKDVVSDVDRARQLTKNPPTSILSDYKNIEQLRLANKTKDYSTVNKNFSTLFPDKQVFNQTKKEASELLNKYKPEFIKKFGAGTDEEVLLYGAHKDLENLPTNQNFLADDEFAKSAGLTNDLSNQHKFLSDAYQLEFSGYFNKNPQTGGNKQFSEYLSDQFEPVITANKLNRPIQVKRTSNFNRPVKTMREGSPEPIMLKYDELQEGDIIYPEHNWSTTSNIEGDVWGSGSPTSKVARINLPAGQSTLRPNMYKGTQYANEEELVLPSKLGYKVSGSNPQGFGDDNPRFIFDVFGSYKKGGSTKDYIEIDIPEEQIQDYIDQGYIIEPISKPKMEQGGTPSQLWYQYTGTPWSEAKAKGLTDGSVEQNLALAKRIQSGEFGEPSLNIQEYENRRAGYDNMVSNMVSQGQTLDQLVESRVGTREGLLKRFPDLFSESAVPTRTQVIPTSKAKTKTPEQIAIEQKAGRDWLTNKAKELGNEVMESASNSFWGQTAKKVGQATYNYISEQQAKDRETKKKQEQAKIKKVEKEVQKEIKKTNPKVVKNVLKTPSVLELLQQVTPNYQEKPLKKFTDTKSESDFATNLFAQVKQNQQKFGSVPNAKQQPIANSMRSNFAQGQNIEQINARNKAMGVTPQNLPEDPGLSIGWKKWEDTDLGYASSGLNDLVDASIQQGKRYLEKKGIVDIPDETVKIKKTKTIIKETPKPKEFIEEIATVKDNVGNPTDSLMSYRNQWDNSKGFKYLATPVKQDRTGNEEYKNVMGVGHFLLDASASESKPFSHPYNKKFLEDAKKNNDWIPTFTNEDGDYVRLKYKKPNEITDEDKVVTPLRQMIFGDINFDKTQHAKGFANAKEVTKKDGKGTYLIFKDRDGYSRFSGGSVVFIFKDKYNNTIVRDFAGSLNQIENEGLNIQKEYNITPDSLTIGYHDVGSFSAKPKASSDGTLKSKQWEGFNNEGMTGGALLIPKSK